jgi:hypothetical protein
MFHLHKPGHPAPETGEYQPVTKSGAPTGARRRYIQGAPLGPLPHGQRWRLVVILTRL